MITSSYFNDHKQREFHKVIGKNIKYLHDATIIHKKPFDRSAVTIKPNFRSSMVTVKELSTEGLIFGYSLFIPKMFTYKDVLSSMLTASKVENSEVPENVSVLFNCESFMIISDNLEQGIICLSTKPNLVDVQRG